MAGGDSCNHAVQKSGRIQAVNFEDVGMIRKVMIALIVFNFAVAVLTGDLQASFGMGGP